MNLFPTTTIATKALLATIDYQSYYNVWFHMDAVTMLLSHIVRAIIDAFFLLSSLVLLPLSLLTPLTWLWVPQLTLQLIDSACAFPVAIAAIAAQPVVTLIRTLTSIMCGYREGTEYDDGQEIDERHFEQATMLVMGVHL